MNQSFFEKKIRPILVYIGSIGAIILSVGYVILMLVLVLGFKAQADFKNSIIFAVINAAFGFIIMQFLKLQGIDFAKQLPQNIEVLSKYNTKRVKKSRTHSMRGFWIRTILVDILIKAVTIAIATTCVVYIIIEGSHDYNRLLLSIVNLFMFACFGLLSLVKAYDFFNDNYIPYIKEKIQEKEINKEQVEQCI